MKLATLDLVVLAVWLIGMVAFGLWMGGRQKSSADYMLGGRSIPWWLVLFSIVATETSTVTFLSIPGLAYTGDLTFLQLALGFVVGRLVIIAVLLPRYFRGELFTAYEVLHARFGGITQRVASLLFVTTRTLADGLRLFLSAIVLQEVTGVPMAWAIVALGVATILYTFVGGMRAVVWTDMLQFFVYVGGAAIAFGILLDGIDGGFAGLVERAGDAGKLRVLDVSRDPAVAHTFWAGLFGGAMLTFATHGVDQMFVQRYLCARSRSHAAAALGLSGGVVFAQFAFFLLIGVALWGFYGQQDPVPQFARADRVFAAFIVDFMPVGVLGVVLGAVFSAAMSTLSSSLNSSATALASDVWVPLFRPRSGDRERLWTARFLTVGFGVAQIAVGIGARNLDGSIVDHVLAVAGYVTGLVLGIFLLGILTQRVGQTAALIGLLAGAALVAGIRFDWAFLPAGWRTIAGHPLPDSDAIAWPWFALLGSGTTFVVGLLASWPFPRRPRPEPASLPAS